MSRIFMKSVLGPNGTIILPSFRTAKGGLNSVSHSGWVDGRDALGANAARIFPHPVVASLDHPPFCKQNGG